MNDLFSCTARHWPNDQQSYEAAIDENPRNAPASTGGRRKRGVSTFAKLWAPGRHLRIGFYGEVPEDVRQAVYAVACKWLPYCNLQMSLSDDVDSAHIRVAMSTDEKKFSYSAVGTDALLHEHESMLLTCWPGQELFETIVLHEFGHALGRDHEHQHPDADIPWDIPGLYAVAAKRGMDEKSVHSNLLTKKERAGSLLTPYDRDSVMHYRILNEYTLGDWTVGYNHELSEGDKAFMRLAYPADAS